MMSTQLNRPVILGKLGSAYGIRGWLRVFSSTELAESIIDYQPWFIKQGANWHQLELESWRWHNHEIVVKIKGIDDRDLANSLTNKELFIEENQLPILEEGEYYWKDLMKCQVVNTKGYDLGQVTDMMETGSNDVLVVKANLKDAFGKTERLIPFIEGQVIMQIDLKTKLIIVDWDPDF